MSRLDQLRARFDDLGIDAFYVPKVDEYMGEYIRPCDERLEWISGFTGSAGFAIVTRDRAALFVDGRYTLQARKQALEFEIVDIPQNDIPDWIGDDRLGFDPNLIGVERANKLKNTLGDQFIAVENPIDAIWSDRPLPQDYDLQELPIEFAGVSSKEKRDQICKILKSKGLDGFLTNNPESIAWLLNIRGGEIAMLPAPMGYAILHKNGAVDLFGIKRAEFHIDANFHELAELHNAIANFNGMLGYNQTSLPYGRSQTIKDPHPITDPIIAAKARKNPAEIRASQNAHERDGRALINFLYWLDSQDPTTLDEIKCAKRLLAFRAEASNFIVESFGAISAFNENAANAHYHATPESFSRFDAHGIYLIDSGGHYIGATTDITRTIAIGNGIEAAKEPFTQVLNGLATISTLHFPKTASGRDIDGFARSSLWSSGRDYAHGTGHGVGAQLSVHEGPASISPKGMVPLDAGMILSLEPGFYLEGEFGIRLENLALVEESNGFHQFETLSFVPFDKRLINAPALNPNARAWLNDYHEKTFEYHKDNLSASASNWLFEATKPI